MVWFAEETQRYASSLQVLANIIMPYFHKIKVDIAGFLPDNWPVKAVSSDTSANSLANPYGG